MLKYIIVILYLAVVVAAVACFQAAGKEDERNGEK